MNRSKLLLSLLADVYAICRLDPGAEMPVWSLEGELSSITRTGDELSIVCAQRYVPADVRHEGGWRALKVEGPLDFSCVGVLVALARPLGEAGIPILVVGTYDTDYLLVKESDLERAVHALRQEGHSLASGEEPGRPDS